MKSFVIAGLVLVFALVLAFVLWFSSGSEARHAAANPAGTNVEAGSTPATALEAQDKSPEALEAVTGSGPKRAELATTVASEPERAITGRVEQVGACEDHEIEVYALAFANDYGALDVLLDGETKTGVTNSLFLGRARVEPDGSFRIGIPADTSHAHVHARGRYVYTHDPVEVDLKTLAPIVLVPRCGACVEGRVTPPAGVETLGEELDLELETSFESVGALRDRSDRVTRTFHSKDGHFEFRALEAPSGYELSLEPEKFPARHEQVSDLVAGRTKVVDLQLQHGGTLRGLVRGGDGVPIEGATVEAKRKGRWFGFDDKVIRSRPSGTGGVFELPAVSLGSVLLTATLEGRLAGDPLKVEVQDGATIEGLVVELGEGNSIRGTVTWADGKPAGDVKVVVEFDKTQMIGMSALNAVRGSDGKAKSDPAGHFTVTGLGIGPFTVRAEALPPGDDASQSGLKTAEREKLTHRARVDGVKPGAKELALVLAAPVLLRGHVVDNAAQPIKAFHVHASTVGTGMLKQLGQEETEDDVTSESGEFALTLTRNGPWELVVASAGYADSTPLEVTVPRKSGEADLVITLEKAGVATGMVLDPHGARIAGAVVDVSNGDPEWKRAMAATKLPTAKSEKDGTFVISGLKPGHVSLYASSKDWAKSVDNTFDLAAGETRDGIVLTLREGGRLTGEVYENAKPAAGMLVQVTLVKSYHQEMAFSDAQGRFDVPHLEAGNYQVVAMRTGALAAGEDGASPDPAAMLAKLKMASADVKDGEETHVVLGAPPTDPVHVHGRVTHAGEPYKGAMVIFMGESKDVLASMKTSSLAADGSYSVDVESPGRYAVLVQRNSGKPGEQENIEFARQIPAVKDCELDFALPTGRISGRVIGPDGEPATGASVSIAADHGVETGSLLGGQFSLSSTDAEGRYDFAALKPGTYCVSAGGSPLGGILGDNAQHGRVARSKLRVTEGAWVKDVDFRLEKPCTVTITVVDDQDQPVTGANVFARDAQGQLIDVLSMLATGADGTAKYGGLAPGHYTFSARHAGKASGESARVDVENGTPKSVKVALLGATMLVVRVVDKDDKPAEAWLTVLDEGGREVANMMGVDELTERFRGGGTAHTEQRVGPLPPGKYRVRAERADGKSCEKPVNLSGQAERTLKLQFAE